MKKIHYNLAATRKIDGRAFALTLAVILLAIVIFNVVTVLNLQSLQRQSRAEKQGTRVIVEKLAELQQTTLQQQKQIADWKKIWESKLNFANWLIERKCFSFVAHFNFLEKVFSPGMSIRQLSIVNAPADRMQMTVHALAQNELLRLYKKLLPYELVIGNENQTTENYLVNLSFRIKDEEK